MNQSNDSFSTVTLIKMCVLDDSRGIVLGKIVMNMNQHNSFNRYGVYGVYVCGILVVLLDWMIIKMK